MTLPPRELPDSDARRVVPVAAEAEAPEAQRRLKLRQRVIAFAIAVPVALGAIIALVGDGGVVDARRLERELHRLEADVRLHEAEVARLRIEVALLAGDALATERVAREELGFVLPGEIDFLLPRSSSAPAGADADESGAPAP